jgi:hypothetical protein
VKDSSHGREPVDIRVKNRIEPPQGGDRKQPDRIVCRRPAGA